MGFFGLIGLSGVCFSDYCVLVVYLDDVTVSGFDLFGVGGGFVGCRLLVGRVVENFLWCLSVL